MFQPGELVVYGSTGVCRVEAVTNPNGDGEEQGKLFYQLKPLQQPGVIYIPVDGKGKVSIRPVISRNEAEELIDEIPSVPAEVYRGPTVHALSHHYQEALQSHCCRDLIELLRSIRLKRRQAEEQNRRLGLVDEKFLKQAERLLYGEFSAALGIPEEDVEGYILHRLGWGAAQPS